MPGGRALDTRLDRFLALKFLPDDLAKVGTKLGNLERTLYKRRLR
jgi:hypothetical protein